MGLSQRRGRRDSVLHTSRRFGNYNPNTGAGTRTGVQLQRADALECGPGSFLSSPVPMGQLLLGLEAEGVSSASEFKKGAPWAECWARPDLTPPYLSTSPRDTGRYISVSTKRFLF